LQNDTARFVEHFAFVRDIPLHGYGSTTFKSEVKDRGCEPDECYLIGKELQEYPEIVLEGIHTSPLVDKLDIYRAFGVAEVWVFRDASFTLHRLDPKTGTYATTSTSALVPGLDFELLARFVVRRDTPIALREFDAIIGAR
jgi:Uma2 family endonuclease